MFEHVYSDPSAWSRISAVNVELCSKASCHGADIGFYFGQAEHLGIKLSESEKAMTQDLMSRIGQFLHQATTSLTRDHTGSPPSKT
jgi:hypothetical protein